MIGAHPPIIIMSVVEMEPRGSLIEQRGGVTKQKRHSETRIPLPW